ncbi:thioredoxin-like protein [Lanmaoa asiatica]|nr:thioredoxin-like protein [Lanmaoa asiatica]
MSSTTSTFYDLKADLPSGKTYDFEQLKGKVVLIVNCRITVVCVPLFLGIMMEKTGRTLPSLIGLQALYDKYKDRGLVILGFPCNQFGGQEPGDDATIASFCELNHGVSFPLMKKSDVNGDNTNPVYRWLKNEKSGILGLSRIKWNFEKFLINQNGNVVNRWLSTTTPQAIDTVVEKLLEGTE